MGRHCGSLGGSCARRGAPPLSFLAVPKRECAAPGGREKALRRVGLRQRRPPAAGGGWLAVPRGSQRRKRAALGETSSPGRSGIHPASLFAAASCPARELPIKASAPTTARAARSEAERAERESRQMRPCTPLTSASTPRESAFKPVPHPAAPVGQSSQTRRHPLAPPPVQQLCTHVQSCGQSAFFSYTGRGAFSFWR